MTRAEHPPVRDDGLQFEEHRRFQKRVWRGQRVAWICFVVLLIAALAGLTGSGGPLSSATATTNGGTIKYPRITRWGDTDTLHVTFGAGSGERILALSSSFFRGFQVQSIQPQPVRSEALPDGQRLIFAAAGEASGSEVTLNLRVQRMGLVSFDASLDGSPAIGLETLALP